MNENPRTELDVVSDSDRSGVLDETESRQLTELDQLREFLGNPERILGFPVEALFRLDILTKNYPSVFYPTKNNWNKRYGLEELIDPQQPGHPFSNLVGYSFAETQRLKLKYPDSLAIAQAEVGLAIQAFC